MEQYRETALSSIRVTVTLATLGRRIMSKLNRADLDQLEKRELQLTILAGVFVLVLATGLAAFMYPLVFVHPEGNKWTLRVAFFGFIGLTLLFVGYLVDRQRMVGNLKQHLLQELERNVELRLQANVDLLHSMPDINHFWDRLTMEVRRAAVTEKKLSLLLVSAKPPAGAKPGSVDPASFGAVAKAMSRKLRPTDSIYRLATELFGLVLAETEPANAQRVALRLQEEMQEVRAKFGGIYDINCYHYPEQVQSAHELEDIVKSMLPEEHGWPAPETVETT
jgi:GGDEF domain-containing protein